MLQMEDNLRIPEMTRLVAKAAFPKGSIAITLRDELGAIFADHDFAELYPALGQPAESPARLALVTILQYVENMTDRQAADAVRGRIDWKYALGLELNDPGFHYSVLSEFRQRLIDGQAERRLLDKLLERCETKGLLAGKRKQRTDSTHVLAAIRMLSLVELVGETIRRTLEDLARVAPDWLKGHLHPDWIERYGRPFVNDRLPKSKEEHYALAETVGRDGIMLLTAVWGEDVPPAVKQLRMVEVLRRIWLQQFYLCDEEVHWRTKEAYGQPPAALMIASPEDLDASYCVKHSTDWTGYRVHLTETCEAEHPHLITQVETTPATTHDVRCTETIQDNLAARNLLPDTHLVDAGYMEIDLLIKRQKKGIDLVGPVPSHKSWQSRTEDAFDHTQFTIDWDAKCAICPNGKTSAYYAERETTRGTPNVMFAFHVEDCRACPLRARCTRAENVGRTLTVYSQERYQAQEQARHRQETEAFKTLYGERAGIEGTHSQGVRRMGLGRSRYLGLARTHVQHVATAAAINTVSTTTPLRPDSNVSLSHSS